MNPPKVHIVGAGVSGLSAAVALSERTASIEVSEGAPQAGGRCRSVSDPALGIVIDNGNHLVLGANHATHAYLAAIGGHLRVLPSAIGFIDSRSGERWTVEPGSGWMARLFPSLRGIPNVTFGERIRLAAFLRENRGKRVGDVYRCEGGIWDRLLNPFLRAALNTDPPEASAQLAGAVFRQALAKGAYACRPMVAEAGLSATFIDPATAYLSRRGTSVRCNRRLRKLSFEDVGGGTWVTALDFGDDRVSVGQDDTVILAVPPWTARDLVPDLIVPDDHRPIVNGHFLVSSSAPFPSIVGVVGGTAEWIFVFADRISVTVSDARHLLDLDRERLAALLWRDVAAALEVSPSLPPWSVIVEKRATFASTLEQMAKRPTARTRYKNLVLAGDWIDTGLPATIEGAVRSGRQAADVVVGRLTRIKRKKAYAEGHLDRVAHG